jgi:hypothetical protein
MLLGEPVEAGDWLEDAGAGLLAPFVIWLSSGMSRPLPHCGQTPRFPAKKALTFSLCPQAGQ